MEGCRDGGTNRQLVAGIGCNCVFWTGIVPILAFNIKLNYFFLHKSVDNTNLSNNPNHHSNHPKKTSQPSSLQYKLFYLHNSDTSGRNNFYGVQFHPESVLTPRGKAMLRNFLFQDEEQAVNYTDDLIATGRGMV